MNTKPNTEEDLPVLSEGKINLLNILIAHDKICEDGLNFYEEVYIKAKRGNSADNLILDQTLIELEVIFLENLRTAEDLENYASLNKQVIETLLFGNGLFHADIRLFKPVLEDLSILLEELSSKEVDPDGKFEKAWDANNFGFPLKKLFAYTKDPKSKVVLKWQHANLIRYFLRRRRRAIDQIISNIILDGGDINIESNQFCEDYSVAIDDSLETAYFKLTLAESNVLPEFEPTTSNDELGNFDMMENLAYSQYLSNNDETLGYGAAGGYSEFDEFRTELHQIDTDLKRISRNLINNPEDKANYLEEFNSLMGKKTACQFIVKAKADELNVVQKGYVKLKDNIYNNKSEAKIAVGKTLMATAGVRLGKAVFNELMHKGDKNNWSTIGEQLALDIGQSIVAGGLNLLLGPIGGSLSGQLFGFFRPTIPDPYITEMNHIKTQMEEGFNNLNVAILDVKTELSKDIQQLGDVILKGSDIDNKLRKLQEDVRSIHTQLNLIITKENDVKQLTTIDEVEFFKLNDEIIKSLNGILVAIFNSKSTIQGKTNLNVDDSSITYEIMAAHTQNGKINKDFYEVCELLSPILDKIQFLAQEYLKTLPKYTYTGASLILFFDTEKKGHHLSKILDLHRAENDTKVRFLRTFFFIHENIIGTNNYRFYQLQKQYWKDLNKMTIGHGFALLENKDSDKTTKQYNCEFTSKNSLADPEFKLDEIKQNEINRYYLIPKSFTNGGVKNTALYTLQDNELCAPVDVIFGLWPNDTVKIIHSSQEFIARIASTKHQIFETSLESLYHLPFEKPNGRNVEKQIELKYSLPTKNAWLQILQSSEGNSVKATYLLKNGDPFVRELNLDKYRFFEGGVCDIQRIAETLYGKFTVNGELNLLHIVQGYDGQNFFEKNRSVKPKDPKEGPIEILRSQNKRFSVRLSVFNFAGKFYSVAQKNEQINEETRVFLFDEEKLLGSVFKHYSERFNTTGELIMQEDGNFVLYEENRRPFAASDTHNNPSNTFLHLTNEGKLKLIRYDNKETASTFSISGVESNRLNGGEEIRISDKRISSNGKYVMKYCAKHGSYSGRPNLNLYISDGKTCKAVFSEDYTSNYDSDVTRNYVRLNGGRLILTVWYRNVRYVGGDQVFVYDQRILDKTIDGSNTYLELTNEGKLNVNKIDGDRFLATLFDFEK